MKNIIDILNSNFKIVSITIENFTILNSELTIHIQIFSKEFGEKTITFKNVTNINIESEYYASSDKSSIITQDLTTAQLEGVKYKISICVDAMTFYCNDIAIDLP